MWEKTSIFSILNFFQQIKNKKSKNIKFFSNESKLQLFIRPKIFTILQRFYKGIRYIIVLTPWYSVFHLIPVPVQIPLFWKDCCKCTNLSSLTILLFFFFSLFLLYEVTHGIQNGTKVKQVTKEHLTETKK